MIIVHGNIPLKPDKRDEALELARVMSEATQREDGCISYDFYIGLRDPNTLLLFQEWESMDALMGHFQTEHMKSFLDGLPELVSGEITTRRYAVQNVEQDDDDGEESEGPVPDETSEETPVIH